MTITRRLLLGVAPLALVGCTSTSDDDVVGFTSGDGSFTLVPGAEREAAPELTGPTLDGETLSISDFKGKVIVLNVWGSWCAPCRHEAPALVEAADQTKDVAQFVGIDTRDLDVAPAQAFVRAFDITYPNIYDPDGALLLEFGALPPKAIPSTLIIDQQYRIAARIIGEATVSTLVGAITDIAAGK